MLLKRTVAHIFVITLCGVSLLGCFAKPSFIQDRDKTYMSAESIPPLKIPPGIASSAFTNFYPVPNRTYNGVVAINKEPPGLYNG